MGTIVYTNEVGFEQFGDMLWGVGRELWNEASEETRQLVWERVEEWVDCLSYNKEIPSETEINDVVSFACGDLFFPPTFRLEICRNGGTELIEKTEFEGIGAENNATEYYENWKSEHEDEDNEWVAKLVNTETDEVWEL